MRRASSRVRQWRRCLSPASAEGCIRDVRSGCHSLRAYSLAKQGDSCAALYSNMSMRVRSYDTLERTEKNHNELSERIGKNESPQIPVACAPMGNRKCAAAGLFSVGYLLTVVQPCIMI